MYFGLFLFHAVWTFNIVYTSSCNFLVEFHVEFIYHSCQVLLSKLYLWVRPHWKQKVHIKMSVSHEIQYIIWVPPSKLFILKHTNNNEKQHKGLFLETAVTNCLVTAWSPAWDSLNSQWLQGTRLTPMCWPFEVLALKKAHKEWGVTLHYKISPCLLQRWTRGGKKAARSQMVGEAGSILLFTWCSWSWGEGSLQEAVLTCRRR